MITRGEKNRRAHIIVTQCRRHCLLAEDGDYNTENKKLRNVSEPQANNDSNTKKYVDTEVSKTLKRDGSNKMTGLLDMNNSRIENFGPGRHGTADALTHLQLEAFYFDLNTNDGKIEGQNPIDMKNQKNNWITRSTSSQRSRNKILH